MQIISSLMYSELEKSFTANKHPAFWVTPAPNTVMVRDILVIRYQ